MVHFSLWPTFTWEDPPFLPQYKKNAQILAHQWVVTLVWTIAYPSQVILKFLQQHLQFSHLDRQSGRRFISEKKKIRPSEDQSIKLKQEGLSYFIITGPMLQCSSLLTDKMALQKQYVESQNLIVTSHGEQTRDNSYLLSLLQCALFSSSSWFPFNAWPATEY